MPDDVLCRTPNSRMSKKTLVSWSSGKDSAWMLHTLRQQAKFDVTGLFCTVDQDFNRIPMHGVSAGLVEQQAASTRLPLYRIPLPHPASNNRYEKAMESFIGKVRRENVECFAFGDLFLEDVRTYREDTLRDTGIEPIFPLWGEPTAQLAAAMTGSGLRAKISCIDPARMARTFAGREFDEVFLADLPESVDPCGENGEFHSFVFDGPMFASKIDVSVQGITERDGFVFADLAMNGA